MQKTIWTFGLIAGAIMSVMMVITMRFMGRFGFDTGEVIGYTTMIAAFLLVFFGVRSYRDNVAGGKIGFGRAFAVGLGIVAIASVCYTATWEVLYYNYMPEFGARYEQYTLDRARARGASESELAKMRLEAEQFKESYKNPVYNSAVTFLEPLPVGVLIALISAGILRRKRRDEGAALAAA